MMILLDSFAWLEYFMGTKKGEKVRELVDDDTQIYTSPIVIAEIYSKSVRTEGTKKAEERKDFIIDRCVVVPIDEKIAVKAAQIHAEAKKEMQDFGLADAFILATARAKGVKVLTWDPHFEVFEEGVTL